MDSTITLLKSMTDNTIHALSFADYENATNYLEILYRETMRSIHEAQLLKYQHLRRFDLALEHAMKIIQVAPAHYSGYMYAGDCLVEQSKLHEAVSLFDQGLRRQEHDHHSNIIKPITCNNNNNNNNELLLLLSNRRQQISNQLNHRIPDWIHQLPFGVVCDDILPYLSIQDRRTCLNVSRSWRSLISGCTNLWRVLEFHGCSNIKQQEGHDGVLINQDHNIEQKVDLIDTGKSNCDLLECLGPHVTRVTFSRMSAQELQIVFERMILLKCTRLKSLCLSECNISTDQIAFYMNRMYQSNNNKKGGLRYLEIIQHQQCILLEKLLDSCSPSLSHLYIKQNPKVKKRSPKVLHLGSSSSSSRDNDNNDNHHHGQQQQLDIDDDLTLHKPINITHLYLDCTKPIDHLLQFCPNLEYLVLENRPQLELYRYSQLCPRLHYFQHNTGTLTAATTRQLFPIWNNILIGNRNRSNSNDNMLPLLVPVSQPQQQQRQVSPSHLAHDSEENDRQEQQQQSLQDGQLQHLILGKSKISNQERIYIKRIIEQNYDVLKTFTLLTQQGDRRNWAWVFGGALDPCRLVRLDLSVELNNSLVPLLRRSATTLQHVALRSMVCVNDDVLDTLGELSHLRTLILLDCINTTEQGTVRLFEPLSCFNQGGDSIMGEGNNGTMASSDRNNGGPPFLLEHLEIAGYSFCLTEHVLNLIGKIPNLKKFKLSWCGFGSANRMHSLVKTMVSCKSRVEYISFTRSSIHADTLDILGDLLGLQRLKLCMCTNVTDLGVRRLVDKKKKDRLYLKISECNLLSSQVVHYAHDIMGDRFCYIKG
ncbi:hypothetical protein BDA99DRAFT_558023 [Phascolomyces articulosus]|uniref:F-box domain-containing protein n=1 Tax=Phascolomyces articulosus TaxID=60185 RepID=A0AAD5KG46_9FUNG|nr:hypothetical protein BDA99DRAFT_558023 [Phascolomyces articulosus]